MLWVHIRTTLGSRFSLQLLMSTYNKCFYGELWKIISKSSSTTWLISFFSQCTDHVSFNVRLDSTIVAQLFKCTDHVSFNVRLDSTIVAQLFQCTDQVSFSVRLDSAIVAELFQCTDHVSFNVRLDSTIVSLSCSSALIMCPSA